MISWRGRILNKCAAWVRAEVWWMERAHGFAIPCRGAPDFVGCGLLGFRETTLWKWLARQPRPDGWVVDVGACVGEFALCCADLWGRAIRYVGIEPSPNAAAYLERLVELNELVNAVIVPLALWNSGGLAPRWADADFASGTTLVGTFADPGRFRRRAARVPLIEGDQVLASLNVDRVALLKVDVEGSEVEVLEGLRRTLATHRPVIMFEALPTEHRLYPAVQPIPDESERRERRARLERLANLLSDLGYRIRHVLPDQDIEVSDLPTHANRVTSIELVNYAAIPEAGAS